MNTRFSALFYAFITMTAPICGQCFYEVDQIAEPCHCFELHADFLYWKPSVDSMPFGGTQVTTATSSQINIQSVHFDYAPGFRVGAGFAFDGGWDLIAEWTRLHTSNSSSINAAAGQIVLAAWPINQTILLAIPNATQFSNYDFVNVDFVKTYALGNHFVFSPFFGGAGAFIHQKLDQNQTFTVSGAILTETSRVRNNFNGGGLHLGFESEYLPCSCLSLYGKGAYTLCYGTFDQINHQNTPTVTGGFVFAQSDRHSQSIANGFDIEAGLRGYFCLCGWEWMAHASYEFVVWPHQIRLQDNFVINGGGGSRLLATTRGHGDVSFQGLTTGLSVRF